MAEARDAMKMGKDMTMQEVTHVNASGCTFDMAIAMEDAPHEDPKTGGILAQMYNMGVQLSRDRKVIEALTLFKRIAKDYPGHTRTHNWLGVLYAQTGDLEKAERHMKEAVRQEPENMMYLNNLGALYVILQRKPEALAALGKVVATRPDYVEALENYGLLKLQSGQLEEAIEIYERSLARNPHSMRGWCNLIFAKDFDPKCTPQEAYELRRQFGLRFVPKDPQHEWPNDRDPDRVLRVGYVSGDFNMHSAAFCFGAPVMGHKGIQRDHTPVQSYVYSSTPIEHNFVDDVHDKFKTLTHHWRDCVGKTDEEVITMIHKDQIDILVDLSAYSRYGRPGVFLMKPAPIEVTAWGHAQGTGWPTVDYLFSDEWAIPQDMKKFHVEQVVHLPSIISFAPAEYATEMPECPLTMNGGQIKFAAFNRLIKATTLCLDTWAAVLKACPTSRLHLKESALHEKDTQQWVLENFAARGIGAERLEMQGKTMHVQHLHAFAEVDLALDPFPHGGGVTMAEGLWMGVPAITLMGPRIQERLAYSFYKQLEVVAPDVPWLELFVATTMDEYVVKAAYIYKNPTLLIPIRRGLRGWMEKTAMLDHTGYTEVVEAAYREMWRRWLAGDPTSVTA